MFSSKDSKAIATKIAASASDIRGSISTAIEQCVVHRDEVPFVTELTNTLSGYLDPALHAAGLAALTRTIRIHQKPRVSYRNAAGVDVRCELGDILFVVKYFLPGGVTEAKSVVHQAKSSRAVGDLRCDIDPVQLELLKEWPTLACGRTAAGGPQPYSPKPWTLEFGSYMLMRRRPDFGEHLAPYRRDYGVLPSAWRVDADGPGTVDMVQVPFTLLAGAALFNHVAFVNGEPHTANGSVAPLIDALYRYVGWAPDPPDEFDGYFEDYSNRPEAGGFSVIEVRVALAGTDEAVRVKKIALPPGAK